MSQRVISTGAVCFGVVTGFITYRTLVRTRQHAQISDLAAVLAAVGGGAVTALFPEGTDAFGWYAIGLVIGMLCYLVLSLVLKRGKAQIDLLSDDPDIRPQ